MTFTEDFLFTMYLSILLYIIKYIAFIYIMTRLVNNILKIKYCKYRFLIYIYLFNSNSKSKSLNQKSEAL